MAKRTAASTWVRMFNRHLAALTRNTRAVQTRAAKTAVKRATTPKPPPATPGDWLGGMALGPGGARRYHLYRPPDLQSGERLPLLVMLHGCGQDAAGFALSTRMNALARRERFLVLYPEQDRLASAQRCWNWYDTRNGRAHTEVALILAAIDQVCLLQPVDRACVALAGLSAGASMAALIASHHPARFKAVVMHSGIAPGAAESTATALAAMRGHRLPAPLSPSPVQALLPLPPLLVIQGGRDTVVAARNGAAAAAAWALAAGAAAGATRSQQRGQRHPMQVTDFKHRGRIAATLIDVDQLGHAWSGGAANQPYSDAQGPDASRLVWAFVSKHFPAPVAAAPKAPPRAPAHPAFNLPALLNPFALLALKGATLTP